MKTTRTKEIIVEIERIRVTCRRTRQIVNQCRECRTETDFVTVTEAARIIGSNMQTIFRLTKAAVLHPFPAANDEIYVCLASVMAFEENRFR